MRYLGRSVISLVVPPSDCMFRIAERPYPLHTSDTSTAGCSPPVMRSVYHTEARAGHDQATELNWRDSWAWRTMGTVGMMNESSRAAVFSGPGEPLEICRYPLPAITEGEILTKVTSCTICGSDLHSFEGRRTVPTPIVLGHEIVGRVHRLPEEGETRDFYGQRLRVGDRVTWSIAASCGTCVPCGRGLPQKCERLFKYGHQQLVVGYELSGGLADFCRIRVGTAIFRIPEELPDDTVCPANCATATVSCTLRQAGPVKDAVVVILGAGMLGLTASALSRFLGARAVIVSDVRPERLAKTRMFGATHTTTADALPKTVEAVTRGHGADVVIEVSGVPEAVEQGIGCLRVGGTFMLVGSVFPTRPVSLLAEHVVRNLLTIRGVHNYAPHDLATAIDFLRKTWRRFPFADLVEAHYPLEQANDAFAYALRTRAVRVAVVPE